MDALVSVIRQIAWDEPECVRLYVSQGDRGRFVRIDWQEQALEQLVLGMRQIPWVAPDCVQLFVCAHDDARFVEVDWQRTTER